MSRAQGGDVRNERIGRKAIDHVGEQHRQGALAIARREIAERTGIIGLDEFGLHFRQDLHHPPHAGPPPLRRDEVLHAVSERHDADIVVVLRRGVRQLERRLDREVEPRDAGRDVGGHEPASIEHEQDLLTALGFVLARDHLGAPGRRLPIDVPQVVTRDPLAQ